MDYNRDVRFNAKSMISSDNVFLKNILILFTKCLIFKNLSDATIINIILGLDANQNKWIFIQFPEIN